MSSKEDILNLISALTNHAIPASPIAIRDINEDISWQYETYSYDSVWRNDDFVPLTIRLYRSPLTFWQTQDAHKAERVWAVLRRLRLDGLPAPHPLARGKFEGTQYIIWLQVSGQPLTSLDADKLKSVVPHIAELLSRLHSLDHNGLNTEPLYQATVAGTLVRMLLWSREMNNEELRQIIARLKPTVANIRSWPHRLIHGEPILENMTIIEDRITALTNWENAAIGDPRWDVMTAAHRIHQNDPTLADQLVNWYETFSGQTIDERPFWYALIAVRLWALKAWLVYAIKSGKASTEAISWTDGLAEARDNAFKDLTNAGL